jgi:hypothetical protein
MLTATAASCLVSARVQVQHAGLNRLGALERRGARHHLDQLRPVLQQLASVVKGDPLALAGVLGPVVEDLRGLQLEAVEAARLALLAGEVQRAK